MVKRLKGISVIVCCYNSRNRIIPTLEHLCKQTFEGKWEILLIDNKSEDDTANVVEEYLYNSGEKIDFTIAKEHQLGLSHARKKGVYLSKYEYIIFCDDDNWLSDNYLSIVNDLFTRNPHIGVIGGKGEAIYEKNIVPKISVNGLAINPQGQDSGDITNLKGHVYGAGAAFRYEIFRKLKQLNFESVLSDRKGKELSAGNDTELSFAARILGYRIYYDKRLIFKHYIPKNRLTQDYQSRLKAGFDATYVSLECYSNFINKRYKNWYIAFCRVLVIKTIDSVKKNGIYAIFPTKNRVYTLLKDWKNYKETYLKISCTFHDYH